MCLAHSKQKVHAVFLKRRKHQQYEVCINYATKMLRILHTIIYSIYTYSLYRDGFIRIVKSVFA